jgi:hypothetical protein
LKRRLWDREPLYSAAKSASGRQSAGITGITELR